MRNIRIENYILPPVNTSEVLRYAGVRSGGEELLPLLKDCERELLSLLTPKVCYLELSMEELFGLLPAAKESKGLMKTIDGAEKVVVFGATLGVGADRLTARYAAVSPSKAVLMQAFGAERIEALCDKFCEEKRLGKRYSPGYGDFPLERQRELFGLLHLEKIGLTLTDSLMMTPTKSVTAIAGVGNICKNTCDGCKKEDCVYKK